MLSFLMQGFSSLNHVMIASYASVKQIKRRNDSWKIVYFSGSES
eukprot:UN05160